MDIDEIIRAAGGTTRLADKLGIDHSSVAAWRNTKARQVPARHVLRVAQITGIPAVTLRPDLARQFGLSGSTP